MGGWLKDRAVTAPVCCVAGRQQEMQTLHIHGWQLPHCSFHKTNNSGTLIHLHVPNLRTAPSPWLPQTSMKTHPGTNQSRNQQGLNAHYAGKGQSPITHVHRKLVPCCGPRGELGHLVQQLHSALEAGELNPLPMPLGSALCCCSDTSR